MQAIMDMIIALKTEVSELKSQRQVSPTPSQPDTSQLGFLLRDQNNRMKSLARDMTNIRGQMSAVAAAGGNRAANAQNIKQAMAAAEQDLKRHRDTVQNFYDHLDLSRVFNHSLTSNVADFLIALEQSLHFAKAGQK
ncbi:hypothetical protein B0H66DRAFT_181904 [Apodospora peruviana]|uniref:Uncharacterized protein n=1 Tax=Apodospora peruviana TaxID=516989 RepID=A0AAE0M720_9PEZI|nr:hypothetical protein B0H66DRAFT_181904 [Apodospora peruviana]